MWNYKEVEDEFLGEVLLDLSEAKIDNTPTCYHLEDHDENSSPLPYRFVNPTSLVSRQLIKYLYIIIQFSF